MYAHILFRSLSLQLLIHNTSMKLALPVLCLIFLLTVLTFLLIESIKLTQTDFLVHCLSCAWWIVSNIYVSLPCATPEAEKLAKIPL